MTPPRLRIETELVSAELRVDDDYPALERGVHLNVAPVGWMRHAAPGSPLLLDMTPDQAEQLGRALLSAAAEARAHLASEST